MSLSRILVSRPFVGMSWMTVNHIDFMSSDVQTECRLCQTFHQVVEGCSNTTRTSRAPSQPVSWYAERYIGVCGTLLEPRLLQAALYRPCRRRRSICMQILGGMFVACGGFARSPVRFQAWSHAVVAFPSECFTCACGREGVLCISRRCPSSPILQLPLPFVGTILGP